MDSEADEFSEFMAEESAKINNNPDAFMDKFGFVHECRCDKDYEEDNLCIVPECWTKMVDDAMAALRLHREILRQIAAGLVDDPEALAKEMF